MLYYIDESCVEALKKGDRDAAEFIEQLVIHRRKCKNMLVASRRVFAELSKAEALSGFAREYFRILKNRSIEYKLILDGASKYYKVVSEYTGDKRVMEGERECVLLSVKEGNEADFSDKSILLVESNDDIDFYAFIGKFYLQNKGIQNMRISFQSEIGGGDTTGIRLAKIIDEGQRTCLCIADSDRRYLEAQCGETLKKILEAASKREPVNYEVYALNMHEIENLIPVELLENICEEIPDAFEGIQFLKFLLSEDRSMTSSVYFFDYKKGICKEHFYLKKDCKKDEEKKFRKLEGYRNYWRPILERYGIVLNEAVDDIIVHGICERILKHTIQYLKSRWEEDRVYEAVNNSYIREAWLEIGSKIVTWGCVGNRILS